MAKRKREGHSLFAFAMVCRAWRKVQLEVGGKLFTRVESNLILVSGHPRPLHYIQ